jgi:hypothetical protein
MSVRWRVTLVAVVSVAVLGGFVPHGLAADTARSTSELVQLVETPLAQPLSCSDAVCGKGSPAPAVPSGAVSLAAALSGLAILAATTQMVRRRRGVQAALPAGARVPPFHPPQFS